MSTEISKADPGDMDEIAALVNSAYRGESSKAGWATEAELIGGQRTDPATLRTLTKHAVILCLRREGAIEGCVLLEERPDGRCYLGMLTVKPTLQAQGLGRLLLEHAEGFAHQQGATHMMITVIPLREPLIAWYERRGYRKTGATDPFPYGDEKYGIPHVEGLYFIVMEKPL